MVNVKTSSAIAVIADRTACSILTLFIVIAKSRPLNKKNPLAVSPRIQQLLQICLHNPLTSAAPAVTPSRQAECVMVDKRAMPFRLPACVLTLMAFLTSFFCGAFCA